jgi:hypothetical protein
MSALTQRHDHCTDRPAGCEDSAKRGDPLGSRSHGDSSLMAARFILFALFASL